MENNQIHPDRFAKLTNPEMRTKLSGIKLKVSGNKHALVQRYRDWWNASGTSTATAATAPSTAGPSTASPEPAIPEPTTETVLDTANSVSTVSMLERLFVYRKLRVSTITLECLESLRYTPGIAYRKKSARKDFSDILQPSEAGENESALRVYLAEARPTIRASAELAPFFAAWGVTVVSDFPSDEGLEFDAQLAFAMDASRVTAAAEA